LKAFDYDEKRLQYPYAMCLEIMGHENEVIERMYGGKPGDKEDMTLEQARQKMMEGM